MRSRVGTAWMVAAVFYCGCGGGADRGPSDVGMDPEDPGESEIWGDAGFERGGDHEGDRHPVPVGRDVMLDPSADAKSHEVVRDIPRDLPREVQDVVRDLPYVHRDTGGEFPSRDTGAVP